MKNISMFAVIKTGGKQYKVRVNEILSVEKVDTPQGEKFSITDILMINDGTETVFNSKGTVEAEVVEHFRDDKILVFKKRRRKNYRRCNGHRQHLTKIKIVNINTK